MEISFQVEQCSECKPFFMAPDLKLGSLRYCLAPNGPETPLVNTPERPIDPRCPFGEANAQ